MSSSRSASRAIVPVAAAWLLLLCVLPARASRRIAAWNIQNLGWGEK